MAFTAVPNPYKGKPNVSKDDMPWAKSSSPATNKESFQPCKSNSNNPFEDDDDDIIQDEGCFGRPHQGG